MIRAVVLPERSPHPPVGPRAGDESWLRRINHAARQDMVAIPRAVAHKLGLRKGDTVLIWLEGPVVCIRAVKLDKIFGSGEQT